MKWSVELRSYGLRVGGELETPRQRERMAAFPTEEVVHFTMGKKQ